jgi:hypothetical protein
MYYVGLDRKNSTFEKGVGRAVRHTIGSRSWKATRAWDFSYEAIVHWGSLQGRPILRVGPMRGHGLHSEDFSPALRLHLRKTLLSL